MFPCYSPHCAGCSGPHHGGYHADLTLSNVAVAANAVASLGKVGRGAAIYNNVGTLTLNSSTISGNNAPAAATGTICNFSGTVTLNSSTVPNNATGGIYSSGVLSVRTVIRSSTVADNDGLGLGRDRRDPTDNGPVSRHIAAQNRRRPLGDPRGE